MMKHGFRLIIGMMRHGKQGIFLLLAQLFKRSVTQCPRRGFDRFAGRLHRPRHIGVQPVEGPFQVLRQGAHEFDFRIRRRA